MQQADSLPKASSLQSHLAPVFVEAVTLAVRDLVTVRAFYRDVVGLSDITSSTGEAVLGNDGVPLLYLIRDAHVKPRPTDLPGLFHTAFLLPERRDLGHWLRFALEAQVPLEGLSDHLVSEAAYLSDPEGNGIEIYTDRPINEWPCKNGTIQMGTSRMQVESVMAEAAGKAVGSRFEAPIGMRIGHVHLSVASLAQAAEGLGNALGMEKKCSYPQADFYASGDYHHHIAANNWQTNPAKSWSEDFTGLRQVRLQTHDAQAQQALAQRMQRAGASLKDGQIVLSGPSGIPIALAR